MGSPRQVTIKLRNIGHLNFPPRWPSYSPKSMGGMCCGSTENATVISLWRHLKSIFVISYRLLDTLLKGRRSVLILIAENRSSK